MDAILERLQSMAKALGTVVSGQPEDHLQAGCVAASGREPSTCGINPGVRNSRGP